VFKHSKQVLAMQANTAVPPEVPLPHASWTPDAASVSPSSPTSWKSDPSKGANQATTHDDGPPKVGCMAYAGYYLLAFFAYWFGSARFDMDGDGDFDAEDVALFIGNLGKVKNNFQKKSSTVGQDSNQHSGQPQRLSVLNPETHLGKLETPGGSDTMEKQMVKQSFPFFIVLQTVLAFVLWFAGSLRLEIANEDGQFLSNRAGLDSFAPGLLDLRVVADGCEDLRFELWRTVTYQWTHVGILHIMVNSFMNVILGIPLEGLHGHFRLLLMYNIGVLGGAMCYWVGDARRSVVGMSGGCYSLIGMHVASLIMNWTQVKFRKTISVFLIMLVSIDVSIYLLSVGSEKASHTAHVGGIVTGLLVGVLVGKNLQFEFHEHVLRFFSLAASSLLLAFCIAWLIIQDPPKHIQQDYGWCWLRQVYSPERFGNKWQCVQCATKACVETFQDVPPAKKLMVTLSKCPDVFYEGSLYPR